METDKRYFIEGLFIIGLLAGMAFFFVWLANSGKRDDVLYRIHFAESVSGLALGDSVKFHGVDVGTVRKMVLDPDDPRNAVIGNLHRAPRNAQGRVESAPRLAGTVLSWEWH